MFGALALYVEPLGLLPPEAVRVGAGKVVHRRSIGGGDARIGGEG